MVKSHANAAASAALLSTALACAGPGNGADDDASVAERAHPVVVHVDVGGAT